MTKKEKVKTTNLVAKKSSHAGKTRLRPPIVVVLGHVDHGKTTLLDAIRASKENLAIGTAKKTNVQEREAGGITQGIGASQIHTKEGKKITFIDTPGHAAFSKMRGRGAKVADIAILVVGANDGVKPQTREALNFINEENVPFIVAITKIDLSSISVENVKKQLTDEGVKLEGVGGDIPTVEVSGKTGKGISELLEMISLVSEMNEIGGDMSSSLEAVVIETNKDRRGPLVSCVVQSGTLNVGDEIVADGVATKVRGLFDDNNKPIKKVDPGDPVLILGFSELPSVGSQIHSLGKGVKGAETSSGEEQRTVGVKDGQIPVVIKAKSEGALEAVLEGIPEGASVIYSGVGDVNDNDVFMAKSAIPSRIFVFEAKTPHAVSKLAATESVKIENFEIIYKLFERIEEITKEGEEDVLGEAEIIATFPFNSKLVAGTKITKGRINVSDRLTIMRGGKEFGKVKIVSMRKEKDKINQAKVGEELGIIFRPQLDFKVGDVILSAIK